MKFYANLPNYFWIHYKNNEFIISNQHHAAERQYPLCREKHDDSLKIIDTKDCKRCKFGLNFIAKNGKCRESYEILY